MTAVVDQTQDAWGQFIQVAGGARDLRDGYSWVQCPTARHNGKGSVGIRLGVGNDPYVFMLHADCGCSFRSIRDAFVSKGAASEWFGRRDGKTAVQNFRAQASSLRDQASFAHIRGDHDEAEQLGRRAGELDHWDEAAKLTPALAKPALGAFRTPEQRERDRRAKEDRRAEEPSQVEPSADQNGERAPEAATLEEDGAALFDEVRAFIRRFVCIKDAQLDAIVSWIAHCHAIDAFYTTGRLHIRSPEPECGKSVLLDVLYDLLSDPMNVISASPPTIYRSLKDEKTVPILLDEIDRTFGRKGAADSETLSLLLAILNAGYRRGRNIRRCVGREHEPVDFPTFAPVAFAGIHAQLDATLLSRSVVIEMQPMAPDESIEENLAWEITPKANELRDRLKAWASARIEGLKAARPSRPPGIVARKAECWNPLFACADAAGGDWPKRIRDAAKILTASIQERQPPTTGKQILAGARAAFGDRSACHTEMILSELNDLEDAPWGSWNDGRGINSRDLASWFRKFGIHRSKSIAIDGDNKKGYERAWFEDAWQRFLPVSDLDGSDAPGNDPVSVKTVKPVVEQGKAAFRDPSNPIEPERANLLETQRIDGLTDDSADEPSTDTASLAERIAALDPNDPDHWLKVAQARAEEVRRQRAEQAR
jgi:Protein of unknown function (DUF3631)